MSLAIFHLTRIVFFVESTMLCLLKVYAHPQLAPW